MSDYKNKRHRLLIMYGKEMAQAYEAWTGMRKRCRNPEGKKNMCYKGISFCDRWESFDFFLEDMGTPKNGQSIDRINSKGNYEPNNCRWTDDTTQARNRGYVKLSMEKAEIIRTLYAAKNISQQKIADMFNVSQLLVSNIIRNKTWQIL